MLIDISENSLTIMVHRTLILVFGLLVGGVVVPTADAQPYERTVRDTLSDVPNTLAIENWQGSIAVTAWSRDSVAYAVRIVSGQAREIIEQTTIDVDSFNQRLSLASNDEQIEHRWSFGPELYGYGVVHPEVHYTVRIPASVSVVIEDEESSVDVTGLAASVQVDSEEGAVTVQDHQGTVRMDAHEGALTLTDVTGDVEVDTQEGTLDAEGLRGRLRLDTHEGHAEAAVDSLGTTTVETYEGQVQLSLPSDVGFDLSTELGEDATFQSDFTIESLQDEEGQYQGSVEGGGALLRLSSEEGRIQLRRR